jgi:uncharacterized protein
MKKTIIVVLAVFNLLILAKELPAKDNFLWKVENGPTTMYLLGSIHLMPESAYPLDEKIEASFNEADVLAIEADPTKIDQTKVQQLIMSKSMYPQGETLKANIDFVLYNKVADVFVTLGMPLQQLDLFKPWFVSLKLAMLEIQKTNLNSRLGVDLHFIEQAKEKKMEIIELENGMDQLELFTSFPEEAQEQYLEYSLDNYENVQELFDTMLAAWKSGDAELMNKATRQKMLGFCKTMPGLEEYYDKMFSQRDIKIVEKLDNILKSKEKKTYFVVVGAGHLIGEDGLLQLLKDKGYKTIQM